jgi:hypothetical protein
VSKGWGTPVGLGWTQSDWVGPGRTGLTAKAGQTGLVGFPGVFYPSTRQHCVVSGTYKNFTRQITRQEASGDPSDITVH